MRVARALQSGQGQAPLFLFAPNSIFTRKLASNATLATDQTPGLKLANQLSYANPNYSYDGSPAPSFYGYSGMGFGGVSGGNAAKFNFATFTYPLYVVDSTVPTQTVTYVESDGVTPQPPGTAANLQSFFNAVPVPDVTKIPQGQIPANGTDGFAIVWRPSTNELWEMWVFRGSTGSYTFRYGGYVPNVDTFNGIFPHGWGANASGLVAGGGVITIQDVVDVLNGLPIQHAIEVSLPVTGGSHVPPATRNDPTQESNVVQFEADGTTPNPAFGLVDWVPEGTWCRFPASLNPASAMPGAGPIALAIATAIRDYGLFVDIATGTPGSTIFYLEDARVLGSPYSWAKVNPFAGSTGAAAGYYDSYINNHVSASWTDPTLPKVTEVLNGTNSVLSQIPWQDLQVLAQFSS